MVCVRLGTVSISDHGRIDGRAPEVVQCLHGRKASLKSQHPWCAPCFVVLHSSGESRKRSAGIAVVDYHLEPLFSLGLYQHAAQHGAGAAGVRTVVTLPASPELAPLDHFLS